MQICAPDPSVPHGGTISAGSGTLITYSAGTSTVTTVVTPIALGNGNHVLIDNETDALITSGNGNNIITELGAGATFTLENGNNIITDPAGGAIITTGTGDERINLGGVGNIVTVGPTNGGTHDVTIIQAGDGNAIVTAGNGNMQISVAGADNIITAGTGNDVFYLGGMQGDNCWSFSGHIHHGGSVAATSDTLNLGNGNNLVFLGGSGDAIYDGSGTDRIFGASTGNDQFVINAAGGSQTIGGFSLTNGDTIDLSQILAGESVSIANLGSYVSLASVSDPHHASWTDTKLTITGAAGTDVVTLLNTGSITLASLASHSLVL